VEASERLVVENTTYKKPSETINVSVKTLIIVLDKGLGDFFSTHGGLFAYFNEIMINKDGKDAVFCANYCKIQDDGLRRLSNKY